ncbi:YjdF family protein [Streptomyces sp. LS1784]|uniref:YjdF family protein n=1 Tax=Streptomyces sp. LS1784 TaxID=2851533 RepID=UPI001CCAB3E2|nr:YjdF family protein [Streptomyces sp. LS1784]
MPSTFTVFFEGPFWVGVLEIAGPRGVRAARHVFGAEPGNAELLEFVRRDFGGLLDTALAAPEAAVEGRARQRSAVNPKRLARQAARELATRPLSTAAEEALARAHEESGRLNRAAAKRRAAEAALEQRAAARRQAKERHRGR